MIKKRLTGDTVLVVFEVPEAVGAGSAVLCGEFNDWSQTAHPLTRTEAGTFRVSVELEAGRQWRFRYLLDGDRWENDWAADAYLPNEHGEEDSVVDLTDISDVPTRAEPRAATSGHVEPAAPPAPPEPHAEAMAPAATKASGTRTAAPRKAAPAPKKAVPAKKGPAAKQAAPDREAAPVQEATAAAATPARKAPAAKKAPARSPAAGAQKGAGADKPKPGK